MVVLLFTLTHTFESSGDISRRSTGNATCGVHGFACRKKARAHDKEHNHVEGQGDHPHDKAHHKAHDHKAHHPEHKDQEVKKKKQ